MPLEDFSSAIRANAMAALEAYLALHCFENAARELISDRLSEAHGSDWWNKCASNPLREKVAKRQQQEDKDRWHMRRGAAEIYYTDFGDLALLIKNNWPDFEDLFPDQNWIGARFTELEKSRNIVAHNNTLEKHERDRITLYLRDWLKQVG
ncbi:Swt1 family HEPN domain-containing protein [Mycobacterium basiliense]|nr:Swt1 family HEPN domain-containing protein [Mycobacterium basiliense]